MVVGVEATLSNKITKRRLSCAFLCNSQSNLSPEEAILLEHKPFFGGLFGGRVRQNGYVLCQFQYSETVSWDTFTSNSHFLVAREISPSSPPTFPKDLELDTSPQPKTTLFPGPFPWNMLGTGKALGISLKWRDHRHHIKHEKYRGRAWVGAEGWNYGCHNLYQQVLPLSIVIKFLTDASSYWLTACLATLKKKNVNVWYWSN